MKKKEGGGGPQEKFSPTPFGQEWYLKWGGRKSSFSCGGNALASPKGFSWAAAQVKRGEGSSLCQRGKDSSPN